VGQREHMVRLGIHRKCWSEFLCLGDYLAPPRQVGVCAPRDVRSVETPPADPRRWRPAGGSVAGAQSAKVIVSHVESMIPHVSCVYQQITGQKS
jgi:hypothetical protein